MLREVLTVSALILAVLLVRAIFKNRVPKRMVYALWLVVLVKLLCRLFDRFLERFRESGLLMMSLVRTVSASSSVFTEFIFS